MPTRSNDQIRRDYAQLPWYQKPLVAADDVVRTVVNGMTFGLADRLEGAGAAERSRAARTRAGFAGDVGAASGMMAGGGGAIRLAGGLMRGAGALRAGATGQGAVARIVSGLGRQAGPVAPAAVRSGAARMGLGSVLGAGALGYAASQRADDTVVPAIAAQAPRDPVRTALQQGRTAPVEMTAADRLTEFVNNAFQRPLTLEQAQAVAGILPAPATPQTAKDRALATAASVADAQYQSALADAQKLTDQAARDEAIQKATDDYFNRTATISGANISNLSMADFADPED